MGFPRQASGIQSEEFKAFPMYTLLVERQKTKQTKTNKQSKKCCLTNRVFLLPFEDYIMHFKRQFTITNYNKKK